MWIKEWPVSTGTGTSAVSGSTEQIRDNWIAMEEIIDVEHESMASADSGGHRPGKTGFISYETKANILALSAPGTGALAYTTDTGEFLTYLPTAEWEGITRNYWSRTRKYGSGTVPSGTWTKLTITTTGSGTYDSLSEVSDSKFTAIAAGYYLLFHTVRFPVASSDYIRAIGVYKNGSRIIESVKYGSSKRTIVIVDIIYLDATDYTELYAYQESGASIDIIGLGFNVQRLS